MPESTKIPNKPADGFRLLHTADWHLGKTLNDQSRAEEHRRFLEWLLGAVTEHEVDAIILAGDVFDSAEDAGDEFDSAEVAGGAPAPRCRDDQAPRRRGAPVGRAVSGERVP